MKLSTKDTIILGMLGALMFASKLVMDALPNIHIIGVLIVVFTAFYRSKMLFAIYLFVILTGVYGGFDIWWVPYLYIWTILWAGVMLIPKKLPFTVRVVLYCAVCALHGFLYGTLYAPFQALAFGMNLQATISWIVAGLPFDMIHGVSNLCCSAVLVAPILKVLEKMDKRKVVT